jgi:hypothetical protein
MGKQDRRIIMPVSERNELKLQERKHLACAQFFVS